jgi:23S rRNA (cytosine1962-C5)-methyltransferase
MSQSNKIILKPKKEVSLMRRHPWIFSGAIASKSDNLQEGDIVEVYSSEDQFLAAGHYQIGSITIRILTFEKESIDQHFWNKRIASAYGLRKTIGLTDNPDTNVYRLVHGEGDELPGLIIDYYNGTAVTQFHSIGMYLSKEHILEALKTTLGEKLKAVFDKSSQTLPFKAQVKAQDGYIWGVQGNIEVTEHGNTFFVDWNEGQKTGFFIDQRENRELIKQYSKNRRVLNMFGYTGGFSVYALRGDAQLVHTVDASKKAIEMTEKNIEKNFGKSTNHESFAVDAFEFLESIENKYDLIILDPPAFAKHNESLHNALQAYKRINLKAIRQIQPGGILFTFSCSQVVSKDEFRKSVFAAAAQSKRKVSILHQLTQPADHPVSIFHPEGEYLKGLVLLVE